MNTIQKRENMAEISNLAQTKKSAVEWVIRLLKGVVVGIGFITPGLSGGVLAVGFGLGLGVIGFSSVVDYAFNHFAAQFTWLFIGFICGTFPSLFKTAGQQGRKNWHWVLLAALAVGTFLFMSWIETVQNVTLTPSFGDRKS